MEQALHCRPDVIGRQLERSFLFCPDLGIRIVLIYFHSIGWYVLARCEWLKSAASTLLLQRATASTVTPSLPGAGRDHPLLALAISSVEKIRPQDWKVSFDKYASRLEIQIGRPLVPFCSIRLWFLLEEVFKGDLPGVRLRCLALSSNRNISRSISSMMSS